MPSGLLVAMRLVLAAVFAVAGLAKLRDRDGTRTALAAFGAPAAAVPALSILLPLAELAVAGCLLVDTISVAQEQRSVYPLRNGQPGAMYEPCPRYQPA